MGLGVSHVVLRAVDVHKVVSALGLERRECQRYWRGGAFHHPQAVLLAVVATGERDGSATGNSLADAVARRAGQGRRRGRRRRWRWRGRPRAFCARRETIGTDGTVAREPDLDRRGRGREGAWGRRPTELGAVEVEEVPIRLLVQAAVSTRCAKGTEGRRVGTSVSKDRKSTVTGPSLHCIVHRPVRSVRG